MPPSPTLPPPPLHRRRLRRQMYFQLIPLYPIPQAYFFCQTGRSNYWRPWRRHQRHQSSSFLTKIIPFFRKTLENVIFFYRFPPWYIARYLQLPLKSYSTMLLKSPSCCRDTSTYLYPFLYFVSSDMFFFSKPDDEAADGSGDDISALNPMQDHRAIEIWKWKLRMSALL